MLPAERAKVSTVPRDPFRASPPLLCAPPSSASAAGGRSVPSFRPCSESVRQVQYRAEIPQKQPAPRSKHHRMPSPVVRFPSRSRVVASSISPDCGLNPPFAYLPRGGRSHPSVAAEATVAQPCPVGATWPRARSAVTVARFGPGAKIPKSRSDFVFAQNCNQVSGPSIRSL